MKKLLFTIALLVSSGSFGQTVTFKDGKTFEIDKLKRELIEIVGESAVYQLSESAIIIFNTCFFNKISNNSSYKKYSDDLEKALSYSRNKDKRMYYLYSIEYINSALWECVEIDKSFINEFAKVDKIIPQSDEKIEMFGLEILKDFKKQMGDSEYNRLSSFVDWKSLSECYARKLWITFTPNEMANPTNETELKVEKIMLDCMRKYTYK